MIHVWRLDLDGMEAPQPTAGEAARAARFVRPELARRYLAAHWALRVILERFAGTRLTFAVGEKGKPYLPYAPEVRFNLSRSHARALIAVSRETEVGADIERIRPMAEYAAVARRFFPPGEPEPTDEVDFFHRWTRIEALMKARGCGLYGIGDPVDGEWSIHPVDGGEGYASAVAWAGGPREIEIQDFGVDG